MTMFIRLLLKWLMNLHVRDRANVELLVMLSQSKFANTCNKIYEHDDTVEDVMW